MRHYPEGEAERRAMTLCREGQPFPNAPHLPPVRVLKLQEIAVDRV